MPNSQVKLNKNIAQGISAIVDERICICILSTKRTKYTMKLIDSITLKKKNDSSSTLNI